MLNAVFFIVACQRGLIRLSCKPDMLFAVFRHRKILCDMKYLCDENRSARNTMQTLIQVAIYSSKVVCNFYAHLNHSLNHSVAIFDVATAD